MASKVVTAVWAVGLSLGLHGPGLAQTPPAPREPPAAAAPAGPATASAKLNGDSTFREVLANPKGKELLYAQIPLIMQVFDGGLFPDTATLKVVSEDPSAREGGGFTPDVYEKLLKDLAAL